MWTLLLSRQADPPGTFLDRRQIDSGQIKIGRDALKCDWVIPDTSGEISRIHCTVSAVGLDLFVIDSSTNGVALNAPGQRIAPQNPVAIRVRDRLLLGDYAIEVATESAGAAAQLTPPPAAPGASASLGQADDWFAGPVDAVWGIGQSSEVHDFLGSAMHDFLGGPAAAPLGPAGGSIDWGGPLSDAFSKPIMAAMSPSADSFAIPEDWAAPPSAPSPRPAAAPPRAPVADPFAAFPAPSAGDPFAGLGAGTDPFARPGAMPPAVDPFASLGAPGNDPFASPGTPAANPFPPAGTPSSDPFADFGTPSPPSPDPFAMPAEMPSGPIAESLPPPHIDPFADFAPVPQAGAGDPFAGFGMDAPAAPVERTQFEPRPPVPPPAVAAPPPIAPPPPPAPAPVPVAAPPVPQGDDAASWAAFCEGAGIEPGELRTSPDAMRRLGVLYRQVVLGLSDLIQDRAAFKSEFRVERTQLSFGRNNPLKHLPPLDSAKLLLADPMPGFMPADDAVRSAFEDVKKHQLAMLAGVQHALTAVFERLSPQEIERVMEKASGGKRGLPFTRGVNPWTVYQTVFEALRKDATANVNSVMSVAFREGYEKFLSAKK